MSWAPSNRSGILTFGWPLRRKYARARSRSKPMRTVWAADTRIRSGLASTPRGSAEAPTAWTGNPASRLASARSRAGVGSAMLSSLQRSLGNWARKPAAAALPPGVATSTVSTTAATSVAAAAGFLALSLARRARRGGAITAGGSPAAGERGLRRGGRQRGVRTGHRDRRRGQLSVAPQLGEHVKTSGAALHVVVQRRGAAGNVVEGRAQRTKVRAGHRRLPDRRRHWRDRRHGMPAPHGRAAPRPSRQPGPGLRRPPRRRSRRGAAASRRAAAPAGRRGPGARPAAPRREARPVAGRRPRQPRRPPVPAGRRDPTAPWRDAGPAAGCSLRSGTLGAATPRPPRPAGRAPGGRRASGTSPGRRPRPRRGRRATGSTGHAARRSGPGTGPRTVPVPGHRPRSHPARLSPAAPRAVRRPSLLALSNTARRQSLTPDSNPPFSSVVLPADAVWLVARDGWDEDVRNVRAGRFRAGNDGRYTIEPCDDRHGPTGGRRRTACCLQRIALPAWSASPSDVSASRPPPTSHEHWRGPGPWPGGARARRGQAGPARASALLRRRGPSRARANGARRRPGHAAVRRRHALVARAAR